jgi:hypothetical protein
VIRMDRKERLGCDDELRLVRMAERFMMEWDGSWMLKFNWYNLV